MTIFKCKKNTLSIKPFTSFLLSNCNVELMTIVRGLSMFKNAVEDTPSIRTKRFGLDGATALFPKTVKNLRGINFFPRIL